MYDALYGRQSVDKKDSISVESQIEYCRYETHGSPYEVYADRGFSGKDLHRPAFEQMMKDITIGKVRRVIVYKLDRISRSILDFSNLMQLFQEHQVEFVSSTEKFDTSTPIGRAMLNICIVFAQLERETIQKRVTDAYYARSKRGFYMGGRVPYGFKMKKTVIDGIQTSMYESIQEECEQIKLIYSLYAEPNNSLGDIVKYLGEREIMQLRGGVWTTSRISNLLCNPIYVKADAFIYNFFEKQGANQVNPVSDYTGYHACYVYKAMAVNGRKQCDLFDTEVVLAPHEGIVSSEDWLKCRIRCLHNRQSARTCKAKNSWLSGKIKCGNCGYRMLIVKAKTKWNRYFICGTKLSTKGTACHGTESTIYADVLEKYIGEKIMEKLPEFGILKNPKTECLSLGQNEKIIQITNIDKEINQMLSKVGSADVILMQYINEKIRNLDAERKNLQKELTFSEHDTSGDKIYLRKDSVPKWDEISFEDKQALTDILIKIIHIANGVLEITWNF